VTVMSGWFSLAIVVALVALGICLLMAGALAGSIATILGAVASVVAAVIMVAGFFTLQPNESAVLTLFGAYRGTTRQNGFLWANPLYRKQKISLRVRNLNGEKLKVNDKRGNPVEIAVVIVWRVHDTAQAVFDVDSYE